METGKLSKWREAHVSRERLFDLVWTEPMIKVAESFGVSSSYLARVCTALNVPRPRRGYWAKLEVGKAPPKPSPPASRPGEQTSWRPGTTVDAPLLRSDVIAQSLTSNAESDSRPATGLHHANPAGYPNCSLAWQKGTPLESLVYNRDFVERNFNSARAPFCIFPKLLILPAPSTGRADCASDYQVYCSGNFLLDIIIE
jgi:hypothetical protein